MISPRKTRGKTNRAKNPTAARRPAAKSATPATTVEAKPHPSTNAVTRDAIAKAAYFLWQNRGGNEVVNWLEAEAMLKQRATSV